MLAFRSRAVRHAAQCLLLTTGLVMGAAAQAVTISSFTTGTLVSSGTTGAFGQRFVTPAGGPWDTLSINLFDPTGNPFAIGTLYLLTQVYAGPANALSAATPGFLASATTTNSSTWNFASSVTLQPSTTYYFMMDSATTPVLFGTSAGSVAYQSLPVSSAYVPVNSVSLNYTVNGNVSPVPEAPVAWLLAGGLLGLALAKRQARQQPAGSVAA